MTFRGGRGWVSRRGKRRQKTNTPNQKTPNKKPKTTPNPHKKQKRESRGACLQTWEYTANVEEGNEEVERTRKFKREHCASYLMTARPRKREW